MNNEVSETQAAPQAPEPGPETPLATEEPRTPGTTPLPPEKPKAPAPLIPPKISEATEAPQHIEAAAPKHYLIKWKTVLTMTINGVNRTFHGWLGDISTANATAYIENNLPVNTQLTTVFLIPPKIPHEPPKAIQASCKSQYCVLSGNGMFRAGIKFNSFAGNGLAELQKELDSHIPLQSK